MPFFPTNVNLTSSFKLRHHNFILHVCTLCMHGPKEVIRQCQFPKSWSYRSFIVNCHCRYSGRAAEASFQTLNIKHDHTNHNSGLLKLTTQNGFSLKTTPSRSLWPPAPLGGWDRRTAKFVDSLDSTLSQKTCLQWLERKRVTVTFLSFWLRTQVLVPAFSWLHTTICNSSSEGSEALFWSPKAEYTWCTNITENNLQSTEFLTLKSFSSLNCVTWKYCLGLYF